MASRDQSKAWMGMPMATKKSVTTSLTSKERRRRYSKKSMCCSSAYIHCARQARGQSSGAGKLNAEWSLLARKNTLCIGRSMALRRSFTLLQSVCCLLLTITNCVRVTLLTLTPSSTLVVPLETLALLWFQPRLLQPRKQSPRAHSARRVVLG